MSFKSPENIRSTMDLRHIDRMSAPPEPVQADLPFPDLVDLIEGPRIPLRYGSAATEISVSKRMWRRKGEGLFSFHGRWRSINDYREADCIAGKWVRSKEYGVEGVASLDDEGFITITVAVAGGAAMYPWGSPDNVEVIETAEHLNAFEIAILRTAETRA
jgi:hypothetical protein